MTLLDECMPIFDSGKRHSTSIVASPAQVFARVRAMDFSGSAIIRLLFAFRGLGPNFSLDALERMGFVWLGERPDDELLLGLIGRFWSFAGDIQRVSAEEFHAFDEPGFARAAWNFKVSPKQGGTLLETETRVQCTDEVARRKFLRYWRFIGLFSGLVRLEMLRGINNSFS